MKVFLKNNHVPETEANIILDWENREIIRLLPLQSLTWFAACSHHYYLTLFGGSTNSGRKKTNCLTTALFSN